jgi:tRNA pseudouridine(55) synthase
MPYLLAMEKKYSVTVTLGAETDTLDAEGVVTRRMPFSRVTRDAVQRELAGFTGAIWQTPPMYSALKISGTPLYKLARKGIEVERKPRSVEIYALKLVQFDPPLIGLDVTCSSGTYVRTLAADLARALGTCGHVCGLTRTAVGPFKISDAVGLDDAAALIEKSIDPDSAMAHLDEMILESDQLRMLLNGITLSGITPNGSSFNGIIFKEERATPKSDIDAGDRIPIDAGDGADYIIATASNSGAATASSSGSSARFLRIKDREGALVCIASEVGGDFKMVTPIALFDKYLKQSFR